MKSVSSTTVVTRLRIFLAGWTRTSGCSTSMPSTTYHGCQKQTKTCEPWCYLGRKWKEVKDLLDIVCQAGWHVQAFCPLCIRDGIQSSLLHLNRKVNYIFFVGTSSPSCHQCPFPQPLCYSNTADANDCEHLVQQPVDLYSVANKSPPSEKWVSFLAKLSAATAASCSPALYQLCYRSLRQILESLNNVHFLKVLLKQLRGWLKSKYVPRITGMEFTLKWPHYS